MLQIIHKNNIYMFGKFSEITHQLEELSNEYVLVKDLLLDELSKMEN